MPSKENNMSDGDEVADGQYLCYEAAYDLFQLDPQHELLRFNNQLDDNVIWEEFIRRFAKPGLTRDEMSSYYSMAWIYARYYLALREAIRELSSTSAQTMTL
jgi:hypothetical protein